MDPSGHDALCGPDTRAGECDGLIKFYVDALTRPWERVGAAVEKVREFVIVPRDSGCMNHLTTGFGAIGGAAGAYVGAGSGGAAGFSVGSLALPGGGSLGGAWGGSALGAAAGASLGAAAGMAVGGAVGSVKCMSSSGGSGGSGGGGSGGRGWGRFWKQLKPFRGSIKTNGLSGSARRYFHRDFTHQDLEVYDARGVHLGTASAESGAMIKPAVPGRILKGL